MLREHNTQLDLAIFIILIGGIIVMKVYIPHVLKIRERKIASIEFAAYVHILFRIRERRIIV